jgi:predicted DNA-binding WGR domain protein
MKTFSFMGPNPKVNSGVSWKLWRIERKGRTVTASWGRATVERRRLKTKGKLQNKSWNFRTEAQAIECEAEKIAEKLRGGYKRMIRGKRAK